MLKLITQHSRWGDVIGIYGGLLSTVNRLISLFTSASEESPGPEDDGIIVGRDFDVLLELDSC